MQPEFAAFLSFMVSYCRSDEERAVLTDESATANLFGNLHATDDGDIDAAEWAAEMARDLRRAENGDAHSARRMAELHELGNDSTGANPWWRYAAALGDRAAQVYVEHVLEESAPAAPAEVADAPGTADDVGER